MGSVSDQGELHSVSRWLQSDQQSVPQYRRGFDRPNPDLGRYEFTRNENDRGRFKTPTLREITYTAPYMHDGSEPTLEEVIEYYDRGGNPNPYLDPDIEPLHLTQQEKADLLALLHSFNGEGWKVQAPVQLTPDNGSKE
jgi:cytochrome c peroxidase